MPASRSRVRCSIPHQGDQAMALRVRRVITGHDSKGKAIVKIDEVAKHLVTGRPGATACNIWTTESFPVNNDGADDAGQRKAGTTLPNATIFRMIEVAPAGAARHHRTDALDSIRAIHRGIHLHPDRGRA